MYKNRDKGKKKLIVLNGPSVLIGQRKKCHYFGTFSHFLQ